MTLELILDHKNVLAPVKIERDTETGNIFIDGVETGTPQETYDRYINGIERSFKAQNIIAHIEDFI